MHHSRPPERPFQLGQPVGRHVPVHPDQLQPVDLGDQRPGTLRVLGRGEVGSLYGAVGL